MVKNSFEQFKMMIFLFSINNFKNRMLKSLAVSLLLLFFAASVKVRNNMEYRYSKY